MLSLIVILGCNDKQEEDALENDGVSITLICIQQQNANACTDQQFHDLQAFQVFTTAIDRAVEMPGIHNYGAEYRLNITYSKQTTKAFHLSLGVNREMKGLLVDLDNTSQGYEISVEQANKLRDLIMS